MNLTVFIVHHWAKFCSQLQFYWVVINGFESKSDSGYFKPSICGGTELFTCEKQ